MWGTQFHDFLHNIGSVALEHEEAGVKRLQFHEKYNRKVQQDGGHEEAGVKRLQFNLPHGLSAIRG